MKSGYGVRLKNCINIILEHEPENEPTGLLALAHYYLGNPDMKERAEQVLLRTAKWFEACPYIENGKQRPVRGECDFAAARLARALVMGTDDMKCETKEAIKSFFTKNDFESMYKSENHMLIFHCARYTAALTYGACLFESYGKTGCELQKEDEKFLSDYILYRAKNGWGEFDSVGYMCEDLLALFLLYDASSGKLKNLAKMAADQLLLDMISDEFDGFYSGAHGRIYFDQALDNMCCAMTYVYNLYFGGIYLESAYKTGIIEKNFEEYADFAEFAMTGYFPSDCVFYAAAEKLAVYENFEAKNLHSITCQTPHKKLPDEKGHISKYTYITGEYAMGSVCFEDGYENPDAAWYAHHQQHEWELTLKGSPQAKIFTHHPGKCGTEGHEHGYWSGDLMCCCGEFFTHKNITLAIYDIGGEEEKEINANVLFSLYSTVTDGNYIFLKLNNAYASLYFSEGYYRKTDGKYPERELRSKGAKHAVVCVAGSKNEDGSFEDFMNKVKSKPVIFDKDEMTLEYDGIYLDKKTRKINGEAVSFPYPLFSNPFLSSELYSGIIDVYTTLGKTTYDFTKAQII